MTQPSDMIRLNRLGSTPWGTLGTLGLPDGTSFPTVEPRWENNAKGKSCIPAGTYAMGLRSSPIVYRTSGQAFKKGWEIKGVPKRSLIMIHPGNWASDSNGCILVGWAHTVIKGQPGVSASRAAFKDLMARMGTRADWRIEINWTTPE